MKEIDEEILSRLQDGIPIEESPFARIAAEMNLGEDDVIRRLRTLKEAGIIRRFGSRINPRRARIAVNVMVAWKVPGDLADAAGALMAEYPEVTHCYRREIVPGRWEYPLYTVLHGYDQQTVNYHIRMLSRITGISEYIVLTSTREFKRTAAGRIRPGRRMK
jgi:siroheme decarboxylase